MGQYRPEPDPRVPPPPYLPAGSSPHGQPSAGPQPWGPVPPNPYEQPPAGGSHALVPWQPGYPVPGQPQPRSRMAAGLLGIFLGTLGVHNFYLGRSGVAVAQLLMTVLTLGLLSPVVFVWSLIESILILTSAPGFTVDRRGIPLRD